MVELQIVILAVAGSSPVGHPSFLKSGRMREILKLTPLPFDPSAQRLAVVEPGVINLEVTLAVAAHGLHFAPDPSSQSICTIGGNVAFNSGGAHCLKYGMTSNHVLGIKAVLATGEVVAWGGPSRESVGPDWCGLFNGHERSRVTTFVRALNFCDLAPLIACPTLGRRLFHL